MTILVAEIPAAAEGLLPENAEDASGVGVNYADAVLKAMKTTLDDGRKVLARRRGLEITVTVGDATGRGLMRRLEHGPDAREILRRALVEAGEDASMAIDIRDGRVVIL